MKPLLRPLARWVGHCRWLRFGVRNRFARWVDHPDRARDEAFEVPFFGLRYRGSFASFIDWSVYYFGAYSEGEIELLRRLRRGAAQGCILDVGANVGHHTVVFASLGGEVVAFEPVPELAAQIRERVALNQLTNVRVLECGLGRQNAVLPFFGSPDNNRGTGTFVAGVYERAERTIQVRTGDEVMAELGSPPVGLMKIDVEGFEADVIAGLQATLGRDRPVLFFEWSSMSAAKSGGSDPARLLPERYRLFVFEPQAVIAGVFARAPFELRPWSAQPDFDGNLVAIPEEKFTPLRQSLGIN